MPMNQLSLPAFQSAIQAIHGAHSRFASRAQVAARLDGRAWEGEVLVFDLLDHPTCARCYVWEVDGQVTAILHDDVASSPREAVLASLVPLGF